jgi:hypothetical protein
MNARLATMAIPPPGRIAGAPRPRIVQHQVIRRRRLAALHPIRLRTIAVILQIRRQLIVALPRRGRTEEAVVAAATAALLAEAAVIRAVAAVLEEAVAAEAEGPTAAVLPAGIRPEAPRAAGK